MDKSALAYSASHCLDPFVAILQTCIRIISMYRVHPIALYFYYLKGEYLKLAISEVYFVLMTSSNETRIFTLELGSIALWIWIYY